MREEEELAMVTKTRMEGERVRVLFNPEAHPGIVRRGYMLGLSDDRVAAMCGVSVAQLRFWLEKYPEMRQTKAASDYMAAKVVDGLFNAAAGHTGPDGKYYPPQFKACEYILDRLLGLERLQKKHGLEKVAGSKVEDLSNLEQDLEAMKAKVGKIEQVQRGGG